MENKELENYSLDIIVEHFNVRGSRKFHTKTEKYELPIKIGEYIDTDCGFIRIDMPIEIYNDDKSFGLLVESDTAGDERGHKYFVPLNKRIEINQIYGTKPDVYHLSKCNLTFKEKQLKQTEVKQLYLKKSPNPNCSGIDY